MNFTDWSEEITKNLKQAQEQYWKSMAEQRDNTERQQTSDAPNMTEGMEKLWSFISPQMPKQADDLMQQIFGMGNKGRDPFADNASAVKDVVNSLVESQLHSFGIPTKKAQEELLQQVEDLTRENETLKSRIVELEAALAKQGRAEEKPFKATATKISKPAGVKKVAKYSGSTQQAHPSQEADDLTQIKGIGPVIKQKLAAAGIKTFNQLGSLTPEQAEKLDAELDLKGRLLRDNWVAQAAALAA